MRKTSKSLQKSEAKRGRPPANPAQPDTFDRTILERTIRAEIESGPERQIERSERYKRMLRAGATGTYYVIAAADRDKLADEALREHIAALIDNGQEHQLTTQLRAYAVKYLVHPMEIMRRRDG